MLATQRGFIFLFIHSYISFKEVPWGWVAWDVGGERGLRRVPGRGPRNWSLDGRSDRTYYMAGSHGSLVIGLCFVCFSVDLVTTLIGYTRIRNIRTHVWTFPFQLDACITSTTRRRCTIRRTRYRVGLLLPLSCIYRRPEAPAKMANIELRSQELPR